MPDAGRHVYMPMFWPVAHIIAAITKPEDDKPMESKAYPVLDLVGNLMGMFSSLRSFGLGMLTVCYFPTLCGTEYPAFGDAKVLCWRWMVPILIRNILYTWIICGSWDWFLYFSPYKNKLHKYKMNHTYPSMKQFKHDAFYTTLTSCWAACIEMTLCYGWASGRLPMQRSLSEAPLLNAVLAMLITHIRTPHFHLIHRMMHPWKTTRIPDVGKFLYRHIHYIHHKSYNPTAFTGTSFHPIESTLYFTVGFVPVFFGLHPVVAIATVIDTAISGWLGHDGFQWPGYGDYFHMLHHKHFDGNYGIMYVPLDYLFGTFITSKEDVKNIWRGKPAGEDANETPLHDGGSKTDKVQ